jgi:hypothetical protein
MLFVRRKNLASTELLQESTLGEIHDFQESILGDACLPRAGTLVLAPTASAAARLRCQVGYRRWQRLRQQQ